MRRLLRQLAGPIKDVLRAPYAAAIDIAARASSEKRGFAVVYHKIDDPQEDQEHALVPALGTQLFRAQVRMLARRYELVKASELPAAIANRRRFQKFPAAITFDDDLDTHDRVAKPILLEEGATATFYLSGRSLDSANPFWFEHLQRAHDGGSSVDHLLPEPLENDDLHGACAAITAMPPQARDEIASELAVMANFDPATTKGTASERDVQALVDSGFEIGFHTFDHYSLPTLPDRMLDAQMQDGRMALEELVGSALTTIAYPHGHADRRVASAAGEAGFTTGYTTDQTTIDTSADPMLLGRIHPPYSTAARLAIVVARTTAGRPPEPE